MSIECPVCHTGMQTRNTRPRCPVCGTLLVVERKRVTIYIRLRRPAVGYALA